MRVASKPKIKAKAKVKPVKARPKPKTKPKRKQSAVALDIDSAFERARASVALVNETEKAHTLKAAAECYRELMASRRHRFNVVSAAYEAFILAENHQAPRCCDGGASGLACCGGGCLRDRPEITWAAQQDLNLAYASERFAEAS